MDDTVVSCIGPLTGTRAVLNAFEPRAVCASIRTVVRATYDDARTGEPSIMGTTTSARLGRVPAIRPPGSGVLVYACREVALPNALRAEARGAER